MKEKKISITKNQLLNVAINSVRRNGNLKEFRRYVFEARKAGLISIPDVILNDFIEQRIGMMFSIGRREAELDEKDYRSQKYGIYKD